METLKLTTEQRGRIRHIQNEAHAPGPTTSSRPKKSNPDGVLGRRRRPRHDRFRNGTTPSVAGNGRHAGRRRFSRRLPLRRQEFRASQEDVASVRVWHWRGAIAVMQHRGDHVGSGFGHKAFVNTKQGYSWRARRFRQQCSKSRLRRARSVRKSPHLHDQKDRPPQPTDDPQDWLVLFRSADPSVWNTSSSDETRLRSRVRSATMSVAPALKRIDTGEVQIISVRYADLDQAQRPMTDQEFLWNGTANYAWGGRHLRVSPKRAHCAETEAARVHAVA